MNYDIDLRALKSSDHITPFNKFKAAIQLNQVEEASQLDSSIFDENQKEDLMMCALENEDIGMIKLLAGTTNWLKAITNKKMKDKDQELSGPGKEKDAIKWTNEWIESRICDSTISNKSRLPQFIWTIKLGKNTVARTILDMMDENMISSALIGALYHRNKLSQFNDNKTVDIEKSTTEADYYEDRASQIFKSAYQKDSEKAKELLICGNKYFDGRTVLQLAYESKSKHFMALDGVQQKLEHIWYNSSNEPVKLGERAPMATRFKSYWSEFKELFTFMALISPRHVRAYNILSYFAFIFMFMFIIVFYFCNYISVLQWIHCIWMVTLIGDELFQVATEKRKWLNMYNILDILSYMAYVTAFILRLVYAARVNNEECPFTLNDSLNYAAHVLYCLAFFTMVIRSLSFLKPAKEVLIIWSMMKTMMHFGWFLILFGFAYGVASFALLYPNSLKPGDWDTYFEIGHVPFYLLFGDTSDGERTQWSHADAMEPNLPGGHCYFTENFTQSLVIGNATYEEEQRCPNKSRWVMALHACYLMIGNLLLVNFLIAKFTSTYEKIESEAASIQKFERYDQVYEYYYKPMLPPPFILFEWMKWFIAYQVHKCSPSSTVDKVRSFRRFWADKNHQLKLSLIKHREHHFHSKPNADECSKLAELELRAAKQLLKETNEKSQKRSTQVSINDRTDNKTIRLTGDQSVDSALQHYISYVDSRSLFYAKDTSKVRFLVLPSAADWTKKYDHYRPELSIENDNDDEDLYSLNFNQYDSNAGYDCKSYDGLNVVKFEIDNVSKKPLNPIGRVGVSGRGLLSYWGPNHVLMCVVTRSVDGYLQCLIDNRNRLLFVEPSKGDYVLNDDDTAIVKSRVIHGQLAIPVFDNDSFWMYGKDEIVMRKIRDSTYNADNAWEVMTVVHFHDAHSELPDAFDTEQDGYNVSENDEENRVLKWVNVKRHAITDKIVVDALDQVVIKHGVNERQQTARTIERLATDLEDVKSNHSTVELIADKVEKIEAQHSIVVSMDDKLETLTSGQISSQQSIAEHISNEMKSQQALTKQMANKLETVESQKSIIEQMSNELKSQHAMVRQLADELTQINLQQSTHMMNEISLMIEKSQQSMMAKMAEEIASQKSTMPSFDHDGNELEISATYELLLDFDGLKKGDQVKLQEANATNNWAKVIKTSNNETGLVPANLIAKLE